MSRNVLNWLISEVPKARHALVLTHNISFLFVQSVLLPKLRAAGDPRLTIFADAGCAAGSWRQDKDLISGLGIQYRVVPVDLGPWRRFHPKALLLANDSHAALAIGSGNLTHGGMGANREAWVLGTSKNEGASRISALRDYLQSLVYNLPLAEPLRDFVDALFDTGQEWVAGLPSPSGLAVAPAQMPIIDQIAANAGQVRSVTVLAPYFDDNADALQEIARRFKAPVSVLLQPGRAGLWAKAADNLPTQVKLKSVQDLAERSPFIHAKVLALHREADVLLAVGSANCSKAALLSDSKSGNAELMAWGVVSEKQFDALLGDLKVTDEAPPLPSEQPSSDWDNEAPAVFRILAARQEAGELQVAFTPQAGIRAVTVLGEGVWPARELEPSACVARIDMSIRLRSLRLAATLADGTVIESPAAWVDDESSLSAPAALRRVFKRVEEAAGGGISAARTYGALLEVFHEYLRDPEASGRRLQRGKAHGPPPVYDPAAVFDEGFGRGLPHLPHSLGTEPVSSGPLRVIEMLFGLAQQRERHTSIDPIYPDNEEPTEGTGSEAPDADLLNVSELPSADDPRTRVAVRRAAAQIEKALLNPGFVSGRSPTLLSADIGLAATILVMGLSARHLDVETFRGITRRLWSHLFFGQAGQSGAIPARIEAEADSEAFLAGFATARLAAALSLWCSTEWGAKDDEANWFRLSAAALQARLPALFAAADADTMVSALHDIGAALLPPNEQLACVSVWREVVRAGMALDLLRNSLESGFCRINKEVSGWLEPSDLVWAGGNFAFPTVRTRHNISANISVSPIGGATDRKFKGAFVYPVRSLLKAGALSLPEVAVGEVDRLVAACEAARRRQ